MMLRWVLIVAGVAFFAACAEDRETGRGVDRIADRGVARMQAPLDAARDLARTQEDRLRETEQTWNE